MRKKRNLTIPSIVVCLVALVLAVLIFTVRRNARDDGFSHIPAFSDSQIKGSKMEVETQEFDMGIIPNREPTTGQMKIHNRGKEDLIISEIKTTCGCVKGAISPTVIPPGEKGSLLITFDPMKIRNGFESTQVLTINSNALDNPHLQVTVTARISPEIAMEPSCIEFGDVPKGTTREASMLVRQLCEEPLTIGELNTEPRLGNGITVGYAEVPEVQWVSPGHREYRVTAVVSPEASVGEHQIWFTLKTGLQRLEFVSGEVRARITAFYKVKSRSEAFGFLKPGEQRKGFVLITADRPFEITGINTSPEIVVTSRPGEEPDSAFLDIAASGDLSPGAKRWKIRFNISANEDIYTETIIVHDDLRMETSEN